MREDNNSVVTTVKMTQPHKVKNELYFISYLLLMILLWYDLTGEGVQYKQGLGFVEYTVLVLACLSIALFIYGLLRSIKHKAYRLLLIPYLLFGIFESRFLEGRTVFKFKDCDMSVCDDVELKETGIWRRSYYSQLSNTWKFGTFVVRNDTVFIYDDLSHFNLSARKQLAPLIKNKDIKYHLDKSYSSTWYRQDDSWR